MPHLDGGHSKNPRSSSPGERKLNLQVCGRLCDIPQVLDCWLGSLDQAEKRKSCHFALSSEELSGHGGLRPQLASTTIGCTMFSQYLVIHTQRYIFKDHLVHSEQTEIYLSIKIILELVSIVLNKRDLKKEKIQGSYCANFKFHVQQKISIKQIIINKRLQYTEDACDSCVSGYQ